MTKNRALYMVLGWNLGSIISMCTMDDYNIWTNIIGTLIITVIGIHCKKAE